MKKGIGLMIIAVAVLIGWLYLYTTPEIETTEETGPQIVSIRYGSEKKGFLHDPEIMKIFREKYGFEVNGVKMGSLEMSADPPEGIDALWPSSELAALVFESRHPQIAFKKHNAFSTPIVFYSWPKVAQALLDAGIVEKRDDVFYIIHMKKYLDKMMDGETWKSLGLQYQNGALTIRCTDPRKSNSGFLLSGLLSIILNDGEMPDVNSLETHLPNLVKIFNKMGYMENSSGILFDKYIKQGQGAYPVIANYESLIVEFYMAHPDKQNQISKMIKVLIPEPTVWSDHPLLALTPEGEKLIEALQDEDVLQIAWERFGFRFGMMGVDQNASVMKELGLPGQILNVTPLPSEHVMNKILSALN